MAELINKTMELEVSGTTSQYDNLESELLVDDYWVVSAKEQTGAIVIPYPARSGKWAFNIRASGTFDGQPNYQTTLTVFVYKRSH